MRSGPTRRPPDGGRGPAHGGRRRPVTYVDVFAARPGQGNLLAVVHEADDMSAAAMHHVARRMRLSETSFIQSAGDSRADYRHRIFTVGGEIPFAGHPSLGAAAAIALMSGLAATRYVQQTEAGTQAIEVALDADGSGRATMRQNDAEFGVVVATGEAMRAAGLPIEAAHPRLPAQVVSTGFPTLIVPLADVDALEAAAISWDRLDRLVARIGPITPNFYLVAEVEPRRWRSRCFARDISGGEDPATGSAAGPLAAYLGRHADTPTITVDQGVEMGMASSLSADATDGVVVSGPLFISGRGQLWTPQAVVDRPLGSARGRSGAR